MKADQSTRQQVAGALLAAGLLASGSIVHAGIVNFEDIALAANSARVDPSYVSQGYSFIPTGDSLALLQNGGGCGPACAANGTNTLAAGGVGSGPSTVHPVTMAKTSGGTFTLSSLDYAEFVVGGHAANATRLQVVGNVFGGGTLLATLLLDGVNDGPGGGVDFQFADLGATWYTTLLTSVDFSGFDNAGLRRGFQLDNLAVDAAAVPLPGTLPLVVLGLLGLVARRRMFGRI